MKRYVAGFMFDKEDPDSVLLIHKRRPKWQAGKWNAVGGKIEPGESPGKAMVREFFEETGLITSYDDTIHKPLVDIPGIWKPFVVLTNEREGWRVNFFRAVGPIQGAVSKTDEQVMQIELPLSHQVPVIPNLRWLIPLAKDPDIVFPLHIEDVGDH